MKPKPLTKAQIKLVKAAIKKQLTFLLNDWKHNITHFEFVKDGFDTSVEHRFEKYLEIEQKGEK